jgi:hypothetical protein
MKSFELPRATSGRFSRRSALAVRSSFHQPRRAVRLGVEPFRIDYARIVIGVAVGFQIVWGLASWVMA